MGSSSSSSSSSSSAESTESESPDQAGSWGMDSGAASARFGGVAEKTETGIKNTGGAIIGGIVGGLTGGLPGALGGAIRGSGGLETTTTRYDPALSGSLNEGGGGSGGSGNFGPASTTTGTYPSSPGAASGGVSATGGYSGGPTSRITMPTSGTGEGGNMASGNSSDGANAYSWFSKLYSDLGTERQKVTDTAAKVGANQQTASDMSLANAKTDRTTYDATYTPTLNKIVADANQFDSAGEAERLAQEGEATVGKQFGQAKTSLANSLAGFGINPNSAKYASSFGDLDAKKASATAAASNAGRIQGREIGTQKLYNAAGLASGLAAQSQNESNASVQSGTSALNTATVPGNVQRTDAGLIQTGTEIGLRDKQINNNFALGKESNVNASNYQNAQIQANKDATEAANWSSVFQGIGSVLGGSSSDSSGSSGGNWWDGIFGSKP
jgi:hypothetical protein